MWYIYVLRGKKKAIFIGATNDLDRCLQEHAQGQCLETALFLPLTCETYIGVAKEKQARNLVKYLQSKEGMNMLKKHILQKA
jgi:predicted GIY-YIG superfamily endonuclease